MEAHSPDWPQAHTLALTPKRPAAQLHCPTSLDPDGASPASPQQGGGPTSPAADARGAHRCSEQGVPCRAGGRKQSPWVEALQPANPKGGLQDRGLSAPLAEGRAGVGGTRAAASSRGRGDTTRPAGPAAKPTVQLAMWPTDPGPLGVRQRGPCSPRKRPAPTAQVAQPTPAHRCPQLPRGICWRRSCLCHFITRHKSPGIGV